MDFIFFVSSLSLKADRGFLVIVDFGHRRPSRIGPHQGLLISCSITSSSRHLRLTAGSQPIAT
jgi:hypothetical protein